MTELGMFNWGECAAAAAHCGHGDEFKHDDECLLCWCDFPQRMFGSKEISTGLLTYNESGLGYRPTAPTPLTVVSYFSLSLNGTTLTIENLNPFRWWVLKLILGGKLTR